MSGPLGKMPCLVGRSPQADFVLCEDSVSRQHARLQVRDGKVHIEDLNSSNGVLVNGSRVETALLLPTDDVRLGGYTLSIEPVLEASPPLSGHRTELDYDDVGRIHERLVDDDHPSLSFLYRLSLHMAQHRSMRPLLETILEDVMGALPAERGYIVTQGERDGAAEICVSKSLHNVVAAPPLSQTLVHHVQHTRSSVLTTDASSDSRFESSDSIVAHHIQAAICVPLTSHDTVFGVIYVDGSSAPLAFTRSHLQLLSIVGQMAGAAVENIFLTEQKIHQERLAAIGQTVSATSHDMRNILLGISGGTQLLEIAQEKQQWDRTEKATRIIRTSLDRFESLVNSLLTCAKKTDLSLSMTYLGPLVKDVVEALGTTAESCGVKLVVDDRCEGSLSLDAQQVYRVITNLVKNAIESMENTGGTVRMEIFTDGSAHFVRVHDSGRGIKPEHLERIGQAFFTTKNGRGTGLGLAVCFQIMEQHEGKVHVESTYGEGSTFTLEFPVAAQTAIRFTRLTA